MNHLCRRGPERASATSDCAIRSVRRTSTPASSTRSFETSSTGRRSARSSADAFAAAYAPVFRERIAQPVAAVTMFEIASGNAKLATLGDRAHLSVDLRNEEGT